MASLMEDNPSKSFSTNTYTSLHRRWIRCQATSLEYGLGRKNNDPTSAEVRNFKLGNKQNFDGDIVLIFYTGRVNLQGKLCLLQQIFFT